MGFGYKINQLYQTAVKKAMCGEEEWKTVCRLAGHFYRYEFENILMIYVQRPDASIVTDYDTWKKIGRFVRQGSKGIAVFPSKVLKGDLRYVFDLRDTGGRNQRLAWELNPAVAEAYTVSLKEQESGKEILSESGKNGNELSSLEFLKAFTKKQISGIMETVSENIAELEQLLERQENREDVRMERITAEEAVKRSVTYAVFTRCGFALSEKQKELSFITAFSSEESMYRLGSLVSAVSCEVLKTMAKDIKQIEERGISYGRNDIDISHGGRRNAVSRFGAAGGNAVHENTGRFAVRAAEYLQENYKDRYRMLVRFGMLEERMQKVEEEANRRMEALEQAYCLEHLPKHPESTMEMWNLRQQARRQAEEIVMTEIVMKFH